MSEPTLTYGCAQCGQRFGLEAEIRELRDTLARYGVHDDDCEVSRWAEWGRRSDPEGARDACNCGFWRHEPQDPTSTSGARNK
jgi:hypothetical protein